MISNVKEATRGKVRYAHCHWQLAMAFPDLEHDSLHLHAEGLLPFNKVVPFHQWRGQESGASFLSSCVGF